MDTKLEMIEKISKLYRENLKYTDDIRNEIIHVKEKIKDTTTTHVEYVKFEDRLKYLEDDYTTQMYKTQGISLAREALFSE